jgi:hypothetical protein
VARSTVHRLSAIGAFACVVGAIVFFEHTRGTPVVPPGPGDLEAAIEKLVTGEPGAAVRQGERPLARGAEEAARPASGPDGPGRARGPAPPLRFSS